MNTMLEELREEFLEACTEKNLELHVQKPLTAKDFELNVDKELLHKIWFQLLGNAVKYTPAGSISFGYRHEKEGIAFFITDTGIGMDQDETRYIFDCFRQGDDTQTRAFDGSGLGLSIARELVKLLKGTITVESEKNVGSTFTFTLPVDVTQAEIQKPEIRIGQPRWKSKPVILVAEDDDFNFKYLDIILKKAGYYVLRAVNGQEAVEICHSNEEINLVLMDMKMPVMGGLEATSRIKGFLPDMPIVAVTAYVSSNDENEAYLAGCCQFLSKPVNKTKLIEMIEKILGENSLVPVIPHEAISC
jgi:CheY-like chemotaxis protein